ncbi:unnamed protein product [Bursaphelenchus xylophilus]|uniref:(pine wood nematode) hypothetical protein n=1 Tax=Bursaphelenchus xylophilus TaxID=6326 RepID=A0A7I8X2S2_BURXY|nr:unnamed protein product [Bursaphelenchus xylophilus]CAG9131172.1 unnamed protein product [Bursaphelenchus xylophilus]
MSRVNFDDGMQYHTLFDEPGHYPFGIGSPSQKFLKEAAVLMKQAANWKLDKEIERTEGRLMQYGATYGDTDYLDALRDFLAAQYRDEKVSRKHLVQTAGATTALTTLLNQMFCENTIVYCEQMTYFLAAEIFRKHGYDVKGIDLERDNGIDIGFAEPIMQNTFTPTQMNADLDAGRFTSIFYLIPVYQNPVGAVLSEVKKQRLLEMARKRNILIVCDDIYNMFNYEGPPVERLFAYDQRTKGNRRGHVVSNGSFSKILAPGLRLGWMELPEEIKEQYFYRSPVLISSGSLNTFTGGLVTELLQRDLIRPHVEKLRVEQAEKMRILIAELQKNLPDDCSILCKPKGGYFLVVQLPSRIPCVPFCEHMWNSFRLSIHAGTKFVPEDKVYKLNFLQNCFRMSIAYIETNRIVPGVKILCKELANYVPNPEDSSPE